MTRCTLVSGGTASQRLAAIAADLDAIAVTAVIAEAAPEDMQHGLRQDAQPGAILPGAVDASDPAARQARLRLAVIAPGCPHCDAGLVLRVTLDRLLRHPPARLYISLADADHLAHLQRFLSTPPYAALLNLTPPLTV